MSNTFKNFSSSSRTNQYQKREPIVNFNQDDFPDLVNHTRPLLENESKKSLDYKGASLINDEDREEEKKKPGWSYITMEKNRKIKIENYKIHPKYIVKPNKDPTWRHILAQLVLSWEKYKENYVQLYGEDCYNNMYEMPRDDYKYYDDEDENKEELSSSDEQDYYDENFDDFDNSL
jgi:hypothetical protein